MKKRRTISNEVINSVRNMYSAGNYSHKDLSDRFAISETSVGRIVNRTGRFK